MVPKYFRYLKKTEYSDILYNPTHFPGPLVYQITSPSPINIAADSRLTNGDVNNPSLSINNVQASDSGQYVCQATDGSKTVNVI
jgi:hypothetical protein